MLMVMDGGALKNKNVYLRKRDLLIKSDVETITFIDENRDTLVLNHH
jgi:hypothetical protein